MLEKEILSYDSKIKGIKYAYESAEREYLTCQQQVDILEGKIKSLQEQLAQSDKQDLSALEKSSLDLKDEKHKLFINQKIIITRMDRNKSAYEGIEKQSSILSEKEDEYSWVKALSNTMNGNVSGKEKVMLETYIQMTYFDRIIARANTRFLQMSGGQYELKRRIEASNNRSQSGLELDVIDHYNGTDRSVKTLSGGESFKASLSLALGLSDEIQASAGGIELDTMFVDEGFGSLDDESLNQAINALAALSEGNRLIGIISHVGDLKDRIISAYDTIIGGGITIRSRVLGVDNAFFS